MPWLGTVELRYMCTYYLVHSKDLSLLLQQSPWQVWNQHIKSKCVFGIDHINLSYAVEVYCTTLRTILLFSSSHLGSTFHHWLGFASSVLLFTTHGLTTWCDGGGGGGGEGQHQLRKF